MHRSLSPFSFTSKRAVSPNPYLDNPVNGYACPSGMALHYDDVPINGMVGEPAAQYCQTQAAVGCRVYNSIIWFVVHKYICVLGQCVSTTVLKKLVYCEIKSRVLLTRKVWYYQLI